MVSYKKKYEECKRQLNKANVNCIDLSKGATENRIRNGIPILLHKFRFRIEEQEKMYLLYDVQNISKMNEKKV